MNTIPPQSTDPTTVPDKVLARLRACRTRPLPEPGAPAREVSAWWLNHAAANQGRAEAWAELRGWAVVTGLPVAVLIALDLCRVRAEDEVDRCMREAEAAR